MDDEVIAAKNK